MKKYLIYITFLFLSATGFVAGARLAHADTVGDTATFGGNLNNAANCRQVTPSVSGTITSISWYGGLASTGNYTTAVYSDSSNQPNAPLATSGINSSAAGSWNTQNISYAFTANVPIWLCVWSDTSYIKWYYGGAGALWSTSDMTGQTYKTWPSAWTQGQAYNLHTSVYATYTTSGGSGGGTPAPGAPTVSITAPTTGTQSGTVTFSANASADSSNGLSVAGVTFKVDGTTIGSEDTNAPYSISLDTTSLSNASHTLTAVVRDSANNTTTSSGVSITVSNGGGGGGSGGNASGGPGSGTFNIYVDQTLSSDCAGTYSIQNRNCSGSNGYAYSTLQKAADAASAGNTVQLRGGTYRSNCGVSDIQCQAVNIANSGTAGNLITFQPYNGESVTLYGVGFVDADLNNDGWADGPTKPLYRESLIRVPASYIRLTGFEITNSEGSGINIDGSHDQVDNLLIHDTWSDGIDIGLTTNNRGRVEDVTVNNVEEYFSHHGAGVAYGRSRDGGVTDVVTDITIENSLLYGNGYYSLNGTITRVLPTFGDSQGGGNSWGTVADESCSLVTLPGYDTACPNIVIKGNASWLNVDSSYVPEADTLLLNNLAFDNGLQGDGIKIFDQVNNVSVVGNIIYHNVDRGIELRVPQGGVFLNNVVTDNGGFGVWGSTAVMYNNISYGNGTLGSQYNGIGNHVCINGVDCTNNLEGVDPQFYSYKPFQDGNGNITVTFPGGLTIAQKVAWIQNQFRNSFSVKPGSPAIDAGKVGSYKDPITGQVYTTSYYGSAPDAGTYEYQVGQIINPPAPVTDTTPPSITALSASVGSTTATITWNTSEGATTEVDYSTDTSYSTHSTKINALASSHSQNLTGLAPSTLYYYKAISIDGSNNLGQQTGTFTTGAANSAPTQQPASNSGGTTYTSGGGTGGGSGGASAAALAVSNTNVSGTLATGVTVTWTTTAPAASQVQYGLTTAYGSQTMLDPALVTSHSAKIPNLSANALYHFQVKSTDSYGTLAVSSDLLILVSSAGAISLAAPVASISQNSGASAGAATPSVGTISVGGSVSGWFVLGADSSQVKTLQQILNASGYPVASSGPGSKGNETSHFGPATQTALQRFQCAKLGVCSGSSDITGYGATGPRTRAALDALAGTGSSSAANVPVQSVQTAPTNTPAVPTGSITVWLLFGTTNAQVKTLQQTLNAKGFAVSSSGTGSAGHESTYFGPATDAALKKFQCAKLFVCSGAAYTTGYGATGPKTRVALNAK